MRRLFKCGQAVVFDGTRHRIASDAEILTDGGVVSWIGRGCTSTVDEVVDAAGDLVIPGLINLHVHVGAHLGDRLVLDGGRHDLFRSGFLNYCPTNGVGGPTIFTFENARQTIAYSLASLARFGSTTIVEMGGDFSGDMSFLLDCAEVVGLRLYTSPGYASNAHYFDQGGRLQLLSNPQNGMHGLESSLRWIESHRTRSPIFHPILVPFEFMLSDDELLRETKKVAQSMSLGIAIHVAESVIEFHQTVRECGRTPVEQLDHLEFLGPEVILGHAVYVSGHSQVAYHGSNDIALLASGKANVAHCPLVFAEYAASCLNPSPIQRRASIWGSVRFRYPQDIVDEMKFCGHRRKTGRPGISRGDGRGRV